VGAEAARLGAYLRGRRDALQPEDVGLPREPRRRVPGLRREEVAQLAGISPEYYLRLEQGRDHQPSPQVLDALAKALQLDDQGRTYLLRLAQSTPPPHEAPEQDTPMEADLLNLVQRLRTVPAYISDPNRDIVVSNKIAQAMGSGAWMPGRNTILESFAPRVKSAMPGWEEFARNVVAGLRATADPADPRLQEIVGTLSVRDEHFRRWWAEHHVALTIAGRVPFYFEGFGVGEMRWQNLEVPGRPGYVLTIWHADPGTLADAALADLVTRLTREDAATACAQDSTNE
jgi:transcriptional regulator with XRE-family HTH domain